MKRLFLGSHREEYILPVIELPDGDTISYIGLSKKYVVEGKLDWTCIITGDIPDEWKGAYDVLYVDSVESLITADIFNISKVTTIFRRMMKEDALVLFKHEKDVSEMKSYIDAYYDRCTKTHIQGWIAYSPKNLFRSERPHRFLDANGVKYTRGMAPEVASVRESLESPSFVMKDVAHTPSSSSYCPRVFEHSNGFKSRSSTIGHITLDILKTEIEKDDFIQRYAQNLRELYTHKRNEYILKYNDLLKEYTITRRNVEKLLKLNTPRKTIKELYPFYDEYTSYILQLDDMISSIEKYEVDAINIQKNLREIFVVMSEVQGREDVKDHLVRLIYAFSRNWKYVTNSFLNFAIMGPSGVGKTTFGKVIGKVLNLSGILFTNRSHIVTRSDMIGKYVGHTSPLVRRLLFSALEGVLIIDEAYSLAFGKEYNTEAVSEIVNFLDKYIGLSSVIVLGYEDKMQDFFDMNEGMRRRFPVKMVLGDYTRSQLTNILISNMSAKGVYVSEEVGQLLYEYVCSEDFPNQAGDILNLSSRIVSGIYTSYGVEWGNDPVTDLEILYSVL